MNRLIELQSDNDRVRSEMLTEAGRFKALASRHEDGTAPRAISSFNLFQTPGPIAEKMVSMVPDRLFKYPTILEPSAGLGRLFFAINKKVNGYGRYTFVENNIECAEELYDITESEKALIYTKDFLSIKPAYEGNAGLIIKELPYPFYDIIIMNPPFKMGRDVKHILHALKFLKRDGLLISLCYDGVKQNKFLKPICDTWEALPSGAFKTEGTGANVSLLTIKGG